MRGAVDRLGRGVARVDGVGRVVNPLHDRRAGAELIAKDGRSLVLLVDLSSGDLEDRGGIVAEAVEPVAARARALRGLDGRLRAELQRGQRPDQNGPDQGGADRLPDSRAPPAARLPRRGRGRHPAADRRNLDRRHPLRPAGDVAVRRHLDLRPQHRHRAQPRPRGRLRAADGLQIPGGDRARRRDPGGAPAHGGDRRAHRLLLGHHRRRGAGGAGDPAAALPLLDGGRRSLGRPALGDRRGARRPLDAGAAGNEDRRPLDPPRGRRSRPSPTAGTASPAA